MSSSNHPTMPQPRNVAMRHSMPPRQQPASRSINGYRPKSQNPRVVKFDNGVEGHERPHTLCQISEDSEEVAAPALPINQAAIPRNMAQAARKRPITTGMFNDSGNDSNVPGNRRSSIARLTSLFKTNKRVSTASATSPTSTSSSSTTGTISEEDESDHDGHDHHEDLSKSATDYSIMFL